MKYGYLRISDHGPTLDEQSKALLQADCFRLFTDVSQQGRHNLDGLQDLLATVKAGDVIVVSELMRLPGSLPEVLEQLTGLFAQQVELQILDSGINTVTSDGQLFKQTITQLQQFAKNRLQERNQIGLTAARARGRQGGRPKLLDSKKIAMARQLFRDKDNRVEDICQTLGISRATLYRYVK